MNRIVVAAALCALYTLAVAACDHAAASADVRLRVALMGIGVEVYPGYVRVSEVLNVENAAQETFVGDVTFGVPAAARYITFHEGLIRPRVDGTRIVDRLTVRPGAYRVAISYRVAGSGELDLSRPASLPIDRLVVLATAPAQIVSSQLEALPSVGGEDRTVIRVGGRAIGPGLLILRVTGVPAAPRWPAPAAAGFLAALLVAGLVWAALSHDRGRRARAGRGGVA